MLLHFYKKIFFSWKAHIAETFLVNFSQGKLPIPGGIKWYYLSGGKSFEQTRVEQITHQLKSGLLEIDDDQDSSSQKQDSTQQSDTKHVDQKVQL